MSGDPPSGRDPPSANGDCRSTDSPDTESETTWLSTVVTRERLVRTGHVVGLLALIALVLPFVLYAVPQLVGAEYSYVVLSGSMQPAMGPGDITFVDDVPPAAVEEGDVITFKRPADERTTTHRVVEIVDGEGGTPAFRTKGDNNENVDQGVVTPEELRGRVMELGGVVLVIPLVGYVLQFTNTGPGFVLLFVIPLVLLVANEVWNVVSAAGRDRDEPSPQTADVAHPEEEASTSHRPPDSSGATAATDETDVVSFSPAELRLGVGVLAAFAAYSAWVATTDPGALTVGVAGSATVGLVMLGGLYLNGGPSQTPVPDESVASPASGSGVTIRTGALSQRSTAFERTSVSSLPALIDRAASAGAQLYRTPDGTRYHLSVGTTLYVYEVTGDEEPTDDGVQSSDSPGDTPHTGGDVSAGDSDRVDTAGAAYDGPGSQSKDSLSGSSLDSNLEADDD